jgi:cell wall-associated NlpC family hydrolase
MNRKYIFAIALGIILFGWSASVSRAQDESENESNQNSTSVEVNEEGTRPRLVTDPVIVSEAPVPKLPAPGKTSTPSRAVPGRPLPFDQMLLSAIDERLGSPYVYGTEGPGTFDCSGFVWSVYRELGVSFDRGSARSLWSRMEPVTQDEQFQFGNLVFFSGLTHVGIVADANGFYHASRSHGVVYSPFNKYWLARIDGFRRVAGQSTAKVVRH